MTPAGHLLSGYLAGTWAAARQETKRDRLLLLGLAMAGGLAPDADVALGLLGGWAGASLHRGATHSLAAALAAGLAAAAVFRRLGRAAFWAASGGVATHLFWDALNVWGVQLFWPAPYYVRGNLVHERDLWALLTAGTGAALVRLGRRRAAAVWLAAALPAYLAVQYSWRERAASLAAAELAGRRVRVFPTGQVGCAWIAVSAGAADLAVHCAASPWADRLTPARRVTPREDFFTRASRGSAAVREFLDKIPFPYAEELPAPDGGALVVWRDLREAYEQGGDGVPSGLHILLSRQGQILEERHQWRLRLW